MGIRDGLGPEFAEDAGGNFVGVKKERKEFRRFIERSIQNRLEWANSEAGRRALGPGSPTVPGLQDLYAVLDWIKRRNSDH